uniref:Cyclin C-terminal domain-containing protein n=1 Tax=Haptolina ericina TaxID=156174 RepID=A0A7S3AHX6_9EUKA
MMLSSNSMCKLPGQDGERIGLERALNSAQDIEYWTDNTYSVADVLDMEAKLLQGFDMDRFETPLQHLACFAAARQLDDLTASVATELLVLCTREYPLLDLDPCLLAACLLYVAVRNGPPDDNVWDESLAVGCGYSEERLITNIDERFCFCRNFELACRSIAASPSRVKTIKLTVRFCWLDEEPPDLLGAAQLFGVS